MNYVVGFLTEARLEAASAREYYERVRTGLGDRLILELRGICHSLGGNPQLWHLRQGGYRRINFESFPYYVAYFIRNETVVIAAVSHAARHPEYWKHRPLQ